MMLKFRYLEARKNYRDGTVVPWIDAGRLFSAWPTFRRSVGDFGVTRFRARKTRRRIVEVW